MNNIKRKLTSRKFWAAVAAWITSLLTAFNVPEGEIARVVLIVSGLGALIAYIFAEAIIDTSSKKNNKEDSEPGGDEIS